MMSVRTGSRLFINQVGRKCMQQLQQQNQKLLLANATAASRKAFSSVAWLESDDDDLILQEIEEANDRYAGRLEIRDTGDGRGWGLYTLDMFNKGELVLRSNAVEHTKIQDKHSIQTDWDMHVQMDFPARLINHCCGSANVGVQPNEIGAYDFYAMRVIEPEQELHFDYETTEFKIEGFPCSCGTPHCRGELHGFHRHGEHVLSCYEKDFVAPYLLNINQGE